MERQAIKKVHEKLFNLVKMKISITKNYQAKERKKRFLIFLNPFFHLNNIS